MEDDVRKITVPILFHQFFPSPFSLLPKICYTCHMDCHLRLEKTLGDKALAKAKSKMLTMNKYVRSLIVKDLKMENEKTPETDKGEIMQLEPTKFYPCDFLRDDE